MSDVLCYFFFFFSSRRRHTRLVSDWSSDVCSSDLGCSPWADENDAARIALLKTARYTATRPLQIGAALSGGSKLLLDQLAVYGDATGMSYQLRDDVLGVFGDEQLTGKSTADDLREGKRTLLVLRAPRLAT